MEIVSRARSPSGGHSTTLLSVTPRGAVGPWLMFDHFRRPCLCPCSRVRNSTKDDWARGHDSSILRTVDKPPFRDPSDEGSKMLGCAHSASTCEGHVRKSSGAPRSYRRSNARPCLYCLGPVFACTCTLSSSFQSSMNEWSRGEASSTLRVAERQPKKPFSTRFADDPGPKHLAVLMYEAALINPTQIPQTCRTKINVPFKARGGCRENGLPEDAPPRAVNLPKNCQGCFWGIVHALGGGC